MSGYNRRVVVELRENAVIAGKLRLLAPLGQGGMGVVWAARHLALDTDVAVKFIRPERAAADPAIAARFEREARATARIAHPHVVKVMDYGVVDGTVPYLVMELLRGFSLAELLERGGRLSLATARSLVQQVGSAIESAHERGIVHRDLKPHNLFILEEKDVGGTPLFVKVLDFGVAKMIHDTQVPEATPTLTETGSVIGSPPYMSPEQLEGSRDVDLRSDLWSLAVIVYECLTGTLPFTGGSFVSVGAAVLKGQYRPVSDLRPNLPEGIDDWFAKALSVDPGGRFQSARELVNAFLRDEPRPAPLPSPPPPPPEAPVLFMATPPGETADHAPLARRPSAPDDPALDSTIAAPPAPPRRRPLRALSIGAAAAIVIVGGWWVQARQRASAACPSGMARIEGATFPMGSAADGETPSDETPRHLVTVGTFCMDVTEVTVGAYLSCAGCEKPPLTVDFEGLTPNGRSFESQFCNRADTPDHPINCVDWQSARTYCEKQGKRLPTESEWELSARGKEARAYPWGNTPPARDRLNACGSECSAMLTERREKVGKGPWPAMYTEDDAAPATAAVGRYPAGKSPEGVLDLAGNVWEWTESPYCPYGKEDCGDSRRVLRGGGWDTTESQDVRAARRYPSAPTARGRSIGFRCAR
jgi:serine/threonine protein kinase